MILENPRISVPNIVFMEFPKRSAVWFYIWLFISTITLRRRDFPFLITILLKVSNYFGSDFDFLSSVLSRRWCFKVNIVSCHYSRHCIYRYPSKSLSLWLPVHRSDRFRLFALLRTLRSLSSSLYEIKQTRIIKTLMHTIEATFKNVT